MINFRLQPTACLPIWRNTSHRIASSPPREAETMLSDPDLGSSAADTTREKPMIVEMRTYTLQPGTVAQFEERFGAALAVRAKLSPLAAFWHNEVGPLHRAIHVWPYKDFEERTRVRA